MSETQELESYLSGAMAPEDKLVMEARLIVDSRLREKAAWQQNAYALVKEYGRKKLKMEIEKVHILMFSEKRFSAFRQTIHTIFK